MKAADLSPAKEAWTIWGLITLTLAGLYPFSSQPIVGRFLPLLAATLFLYTPLLMMRLRGEKPKYFNDVFELTRWARGLGWALLIGLIVFPPFAMIHHLWMVYAAQRAYLGIRFPAPPDGWVNFALSHLFLVALCEEFFYRGYLLERLDKHYPDKRKVLGARLGIGWILQAFMFACGHFLVGLHIYRVNVFFPALLFGWIRQRSANLTTAVWLHAMSNLWIAILSGFYRS